ncbi:MAG: adenosylhomocysteinase [Armatimonadota bacterium]|nr:adenosylhomocysteinase [Armatimonadota bacterium]MDR7451155.1 adenosylhomocysteinase [Armatimonadota bacterium]MDR7467240.1 adenosylhomocysteinase [Armatimonadota bacterium]MDR7494832.1 adenosylhomocysteinase [Armatimonadota bacterium]MDR7500275.1 adenosylhomocysteinase [Armatimonadota bacterium]
MSRLRDASRAADAAAELLWLRRHIPLTEAVAERLDPHLLRGRTIALNIHLDVKMVPVVEALLRAGARLFVVGCNPATTRDDVAAFMSAAGAEVYAWAGMTEPERQEALRWAAGAGAEFISEMGGELTALLVDQFPERIPPLRASMEATGTGIALLRRLRLPVPVFNWDGLTLKRGLHNRYLVGLMVWHTFIEVTRLTLFDRRVAVIGYGLVGQGIAEYARLLGAHVTVTDLDPVRQMQARYQGARVAALPDALRAADVVITATGRDGVIGPGEVAVLRDGCILANAGHSNGEIDVAALRRAAAAPGGGRTPVRPGLEEFLLDGRRLYLLAGGAMLNLAAGFGDPYDAFDLTTALMLAGIAFIVRRHDAFPPGLHLMPAEVEEQVAALAAVAPGVGG